MYDAISLSPDDRRLAPRFPLRTYMNQYVRDVPYQALALDVSEAGLAIRKPTARIPHTRVVGLELELPGTSEIIWASAEPRFHSVGAKTHFSGLHFLGMATQTRAPDSRLRARAPRALAAPVHARARSTSAASAAASRSRAPKLSKILGRPSTLAMVRARGPVFLCRDRGARRRRAGHPRGAIFLVCGVWRSSRPCSYPSPPRLPARADWQVHRTDSSALLERAERALLERPDDDDVARRLVKLAGRDGRARLRERFRARAERAAAERRPGGVRAARRLRPPAAGAR